MEIPFNLPVICPIIIGRTSELTTLRLLIEQAKSGKGHVALISGEAGIGKSRLAGEAKAYATAQHFLLWQGNCFPTDVSCPYAPLLDLLRSSSTSTSLTNKAAGVGSIPPDVFLLLPDLVSPLSDRSVHSSLDPEQEKRRLFATVAHFFLSQLAKQPGLLVVEDVHWSDDTSLEFFQHLARYCAARPLLLLFTYRVSVKQEAHGAASTYVHTQVQVDDVLDVSAPRGTFTFRLGNNPIILLSAGVGATPVLAMLHALAAEASPREVWWFYGARNSEEHPFAREAHRLLQTLPNSHSHILYSRPGQEDRPGLDFDAPGRLNVTVLKELGVPREADFYLCGPAAFLQDLTSGLAAWGVTRERVHTEIFGPTPSITPGLVEDAPSLPPHLPAGSPGTGPLVSFSRSGLSTRWDSAFHSLLELAEACDVPVRWSCRTGVCHTCESGLIAGTVSYQPEPLERPAEGNLLICCSQPRGEVMLDL